MVEMTFGQPLGPDGNPLQSGEVSFEMHYDPDPNVVLPECGTGRLTIDASALDRFAKEIVAKTLREVADAFYHDNGNLRASMAAYLRIRAKASELLGEPVIGGPALSESWGASASCEAEP